MEPTDASFLRQRQEMVRLQLQRRGIKDARVLDAMGRVPRHAFVDPSHRGEAYEDHPLPIGQGQTISQPYMVARMTELCRLTETDRVLEVGAGSGYQSAILGLLCRQVYATEIVGALAQRGRQALAATGFDNVILEQLDGSAGWPAHAPYDAILVAAGAPSVPDPLRQQLADDGRLVIPVGGLGMQILQRITRRGDGFETLTDTACRFVNLRGAYGWQGSQLPS